ncbi:MAG TPA: hypothetical protein DEB40_05415 [Elusimicrobia bacterium]|nr:hypothetical protein [Elusimicrobiota bacterium]HBT61163.1 hypothetical protein [Elusimicrobiota bacterium]
MLHSLILTCFLAAPVGAIPSTATLQGVDVFRSERLTAVKVSAVLGRKIARYVSLLNAGGPALKRAERLKAEMESQVRSLGDFAYVSLHVGRHVTASEYAITITFDVVDAQDAATRMPFGPRPMGRLGDPGKLLARWRRYAALGAAMRRRGDLIVERPACAGFYCPWLAQTEEVKAFDRSFAAEVPLHETALTRVLGEDSDPRKRAAAAYLISYSTDGKALAERLIRAASDPDPGVRSAALTVLADLATYARTPFVDPPRLLSALDYPSTQDRVNALAVFAGLVSTGGHKAYVASRASTQLLRLLRALDPSVRDLAYTLLGMVSGQDLAPQDFSGWEKWAAAVSSGTLPSDSSDAIHDR